MYFTERDHRSGADNIERNFRCCACFQPCRSGDNFRSNGEIDYKIGNSSLQIRWIACEQNGLCVYRFRPRKRAEHVRRPPAGCDSNHNIDTFHAALINRHYARAFFVFRAFDAAMNRGRAAGDESLNELGRRAKCWRNFTRVENPNPSAAPSANIKQPATFTQRRH